MHLWIRRTRWLGAWLLGLYLARMYVEMGWVKFDPDGFWTAAFEAWGYPSWLRVSVGAIEVIGGILLVVPWLASYGGIAVSAVMVGAWGTRAHDGRWVDVAWLSAYILGLVWITYEWWGVRLFRRGSRKVSAA